SCPSPCSGCACSRCAATGARRARSGAEDRSRESGDLPMSARARGHTVGGMRILMTLIVSALALGLAAPSALAADHELYSKDDVFPGESPGAHMWFNEHGDTVTLCDHDADGKKAYVGVHVNGPGTTPTYELRVGGDGRCVTRNAASGRRFNLP